MFLSCSGEWLHDARYFHLVLPSNRETAHVCAGYASSWPAWKRAYHDLPTAVYTVVRGWKARTNILKLWDYHPQCHWEEIVSMLVWIARALQPIAARGFTHWRLSRYIDGFLGRVKCSPGPISKPIDFTRQNPSRAYGFIVKEKHRLHDPIVPKCKPMKSQIKGRCHRSSLKRRDSTAYPTSVWFPSCPNQWCNRTVAASWHGLR